MAKKTYKCFNCGVSFNEQYKLLLHYDFHLGEPTVRPIACKECLGEVDIRSGFCADCKKVYNSGWALIKEAK